MHVRKCSDLIVNTSKKKKITSLQLKLKTTRISSVDKRQMSPAFCLQEKKLSTHKLVCVVYGIYICSLGDKNMTIEFHRTRQHCPCTTYGLQMVMKCMKLHEWFESLVSSAFIMATPSVVGSVN